MREQKTFLLRGSPLDFFLLILLLSILAPFAEALWAFFSEGWKGTKGTLRTPGIRAGEKLTYMGYEQIKE